MVYDGCILGVGWCLFGIDVHMLQWEAVDAALKNFVASESIVTNEDYSPEYLISSAKHNLSWKQRCVECCLWMDVHIYRFMIDEWYSFTCMMNVGVH